MNIGRRAFFSVALALAVLAGTVAGETIRVACVGDSITYGAGIRNRAAMSYPAQLGGMLGSGYEVRNFGNSGATLLKKGNKPFWKQRQWAQTLEFNPNIVVIKLGTNDSKPNNWRFKNEFAADYKAMIDQLAALPARPKIFICKPVPAFPGRWGITDKVIREEVIPITLSVARDKHLPVIDLYKALTGRKAMIPDTVHPNAEGAAVMARAVCAAITGKAAPAAPAAAQPVIKGRIRHAFLAADSRGKVIKVSAEGKVVWEYPARHTHDAWMLPNGNVLFAYAVGRTKGGVMEVTPAKKVVFKVEIDSEVHTCQRLGDGNTLLSDCARGRLIEVSPAGKVVKELKLKYTRGGHGMLRMARKLPNGNYLVSQQANRVVREYSPEGKVVSEIKTTGGAFAAVRLPNGNTVHCDCLSLVETDPRGKVVWTLKKSEILDQLTGGRPEVTSGQALMTGFHVLPNGNIVVANYFGHGKGPRGAVFFEVTRDKKVVWQYTDKRAAGAVLGVQVLDVKGPVLR